MSLTRGFFRHAQREKFTLIDDYQKQVDALDKVLDGSPYKSFSNKSLIKLLAREHSPKKRKLLQVHIDMRARRDSLVTTILFFKTMVDDQESKAINPESGMANLGDDGKISAMDTEQTVTDVPGTEFTEQMAGKAIIGRGVPYSDLSMDMFIDRPVRIYDATLAIGADLNVRLNVWDLFLADPSVRAKLRNFEFLRGDLHVRVAISGTPYHYGKVLVSYQPKAQVNATLFNLLSGVATTPTMRPLAINYLSQAPGSIILNTNLNSPADIVCPFIHTKPLAWLHDSGTTAFGAASNFPDFHIMGDLFIYSINELKAINATSTALGLEVYAWMEDVQLSVPTGTSMVITTEGGVADERVTGPVEQIASRIARYSSYFTSVPVIGQFAVASEMISSGVGYLASLFGWSRPITGKTSVIPHTVANTALTIGDDFLQRIVLDPKQELTIDPRCCGSNEDEMTIAHIASRTSYLDTFTWSASDNVMEAPFIKIGVSPLLSTYIKVLTSYYIQPTAMAFAAQPFTFWRGKIKFRLEAVCSAFHRGKYAIYYEPNTLQNSLIDADVKLNKHYIKIIDIQDTQIVDFCIDWAYPRAWCRTADDLTDIPKLYGPDEEIEYNGLSIMNGYIGVVPFTPLQSPDDSDIYFNVYVSCPDLQVNGLQHSLMPTKRINPESGLANNCDVQTDVTCVDLNPLNHEINANSVEFFGEQPHTFRALLKRWVAAEQTVIPSTSTALPKTLTITHPIFPPEELAWGATTARIITLYEYLRFAYLGVRGSMRVRSWHNVNNSVSTITRVKYSLMAPTDAWVTATATFSGTDYNDSYLEGTTLEFPSVRPAMDVEVPFYTNNAFLLAFAESYIDDSNPFITEQTFYRNFQMSWDCGSSSTSAGLALLERATGEDFSFMRFQGAPYYST